MSASSARVLCYSIIFVLAALPLIGAHGQLGTVAVEIVSKHYSSGYFPTIGSYVEYEIMLTNSAHTTVENQSMRVSIISDNRKTHMPEVYSIALLEPDESKSLILGPFKIENEGKHNLLLEMEGVSLNYRPDSFIVYRQDTIQVILVAVPLLIAGSGIVGLSLDRNKRRRPV